MHIVVGKNEGIPEGMKFGTDLLLFGDCTKYLKKRLEKAGKTALYCEGCSPGEPFPTWIMVERKNLDEIGATRERMEDEDKDKIFKQWVAEQSKN